MFAIHTLGKWAQNCREFLTESSDQPTDWEIFHAGSHAFHVIFMFEKCKCLIPEHFPHHIDVVRLINEVLQALRDDHGGVLPYEALEIWEDKRGRYMHDRSIFTTPEEKQAMVKIWERWNNMDRIKEEFWAFPIGNFDFFDRPWALPEERILQLRLCLLDWLAKRKAGQI